MWPTCQLPNASSAPVPLLLTLRGTDVTALDILADAPNVYLLRAFAIGSQTTEECGERQSSGNTFVSSVARGVFWLHKAGAAASESRRDTAAKAFAMCNDGLVFIFAKGYLESAFVIIVRNCW
jgi:hypothetical protein